MAKLFTKYTPIFFSSSLLMGTVGSKLVTEDANKLKQLSQPIAKCLSFTMTVHDAYMYIFTISLVVSIYALWKDIREGNSKF
ncbi:hypothetical protein HG534_11615 [Moraxella osloensis]|jgi:hypothetical protein|nr:hypothetical protein [Moraxella osloensis]MBW4016935.1 hypothetical protein [Moraxella osloensis]MBW4019213.1 hypothetical protein [Moraxella osloensis]VWX31830.1 hypothetical protein ENHY17A_600042 [Moraxellaceae bacterium 17A]